MKTLRFDDCDDGAELCFTVYRGNTPNKGNRPMKIATLILIGIALSFAACEMPHPSDDLSDAAPELSEGVQTSPLTATVPNQVRRYVVTHRAGDSLDCLVQSPRPATIDVALHDGRNFDLKFGCGPYGLVNGTYRLPYVEFQPMLELLETLPYAEVDTADNELRLFRCFGCQ